MKSFLFITLQHIVPHHALSRLVGWFAQTEISWIKSLFIHRFIAIFKVDMSEAEQEDPNQYASFNEFFCRALKAEARPIDPSSNSICCPVDGAVSQLGEINDDKIFQAKGHNFTVAELLGGDEQYAGKFKQGQFSTIYLAPKDYHRIHMPIDGKLVKMVYIPGDLFSVNPTTTAHVPQLFARNERVVCIFKTELGPVALVLVGAMIVASIETVWAGQITPYHKAIQEYFYTGKSITLKKGAEMGRFKLGSTVVLLFPQNTITWKDHLAAESRVQMGQPIATQNDKAETKA